MRKIKTFMVALASLLLVGCSQGATPSSSESITTDESKTEIVYENYDKVLCPKGAPTLAWYDQAGNDKFVTKDPGQIPGEFSLTNYGMIVFDFYNGLNNIKKTNSQFRLARILTGGNLYLVSRSGTAALPTENDRIVAFGPGGKAGLPVMALKALFPQVNLDKVVPLADAAAIQGALINGIVEGQEGQFDYFVIPQPALQGALAQVKTINILSCLRDELSTQTDGTQKYIPQAGLFIHQGMYNAHKEYFDNQLELIDTRIDTVLTKPQVAKAAIEAALPAEKDQKAKFGFPAKMAVAVTNNPKTPNGFGFVKSADYASLDIQAFLTKCGKTGGENDFSNYHLVK